MNYQVIARKFRPQLFQDVVGQSPIVQTLQNAIQFNRIGHAYLFSGPRGVGKTTTARILAKGLNCVQGPTSTPCNVCHSCKEIAAGQSMDVLEIDAASNTGVDNIRELRESARYAPSRDKYKVFIIDEVHMLSASAFNALLKILEEPPSHVVFIMATTERHKVPATILSRCQQFVFRTISNAEIHAHLRQIADREGVGVDDRALGYIVRAAEGSMRDAQSLLDQIISFSGRSVADEDVRDVLGFMPGDILDRTIDALAERDPKSLLETAGIVVDQGLNIQQYVRELTGRVRDMLLLQLDLEEKVLGSADEKTALTQRGKQFSEQDLIRYFDLLLKLESDLRWTSQARFQLEVGLVKLAKLGHLRDIEDVLRELRGSEPPVASTPTPKTRPAVQPPKELPKAPPDPTPASFAEMFARRVEEKSPITAVYLKKAQSIDRAEDAVRIVIQNPAGMDLLNTAEHREVLDAAARDVVGKPISVSLIMRDQAAMPGTPMQSAKDEPMVKRFLEVFRGDIAQVKPAKGE